MSPAGDQGRTGVLPDAARAARGALLRHEHEHCEPARHHTQSQDTSTASGPSFRAGPHRVMLRRSFQDRMLTGVAGGIGHYFGVDAMIVRIAFVVLTVFGGVGIPLYLAGCC